MSIFKKKNPCPLKAEHYNPLEFIREFTLLQDRFESLCGLLGVAFDANKYCPSAYFIKKEEKKKD